MHVQELFSLAGRVAVVTGGSRGLGLEIAHGLGEAGRIGDRHRPTPRVARAAEEELRAAGIEAHRARLMRDVADQDQVEALARAVLDRYPRASSLDAGIRWGAPALDMPIDRWRSVLDVNATGISRCQAFGRGMVERGAGRIVNLASVAGLIGQDLDLMDAVGYTASKGAVVALTRDLAVKWAQARRHGQRRRAGLLPDPHDAGPDRAGRGAVRGGQPDGAHRPPRRAQGRGAVPGVGRQQLRHWPDTCSRWRHDGLVRPSDHLVSIRLRAKDVPRVRMAAASESDRGYFSVVEGGSDDIDGRAYESRVTLWNGASTPGIPRF